MKAHRRQRHTIAGMLMVPVTFYAFGPDVAAAFVVGWFMRDILALHDRFHDWFIALLRRTPQ